VHLNYKKRRYIVYHSHLLPFLRIYLARRSQDVAGSIYGFCVYLYPDDFPSTFLNITLMEIHCCRYACMRTHVHGSGYIKVVAQRVQFSRDKCVWMNHYYIDVTSYLRTIYEIVITSEAVEEERTGKPVARMCT